MPQTFLEAGEQGFVVTGFDIDHSVGVKSDLGDCRRKQILARHAPQHLALRSGRNTRRKKRCGGAIDDAVAAAGNFMERAKSHTAPWQMAVDGSDAEGEHRSFARIAAFETRNALSQIGNGSVWRRCTHLSPEREMPMVCSSFVLFLIKSQWHGEVALRKKGLERPLPGDADRVVYRQHDTVEGHDSPLGVAPATAGGQRKNGA